MKRALALVGAVLMVVIALVVRRQIDEETAGRGLTIACIPELEVFCSELAGAEVVVQDPAATMAELREVDPAIDGWVTFEPWPAIVEASVRRAVTSPPVRIAATPLVITMATDRADALAPSCAGGVVGWRCLVDAVDQPWEAVGGQAGWGAVKVAVPERTSAIGTLVTGAAVSGYVGRADYATNDLDLDEAFTGWFAKLRGSARPGDSFREFVQRFPAAFSAASATGVQAATGLGARAGQITVVAPDPPVQMIAVLAPVGDQAADAADLARSDRLRDAFTEAGWHSAPAPDEPSGLPDPGVLLALSRR